MRFRGVVAFVLLASALPVARAREARAQTPVTAQANEPTPETEAEARRLFQQGSELFLARRYTEALELLRLSHTMLPSPNSGLLMARCLRALGQSVEAAELYETVEAEARRRATAGEAKYVPTADVAASEGAAVRATLGALHIHVAHAAPGTRLDVGSVPVPIPANGEVFVRRVPGSTTVRLRPASGPDQTRAVTLIAGAEIEVDLDVGPATEPPRPIAPLPVVSTVPPPEVEPLPASRPWALPVALTAAGVAVAGFAVFAGFGLSSQQSFDDLRARCGPASCGGADRAEADAGLRSQRIANVGLTVGILGAVASLAFTLLAVRSR